MHYQQNRFQRTPFFPNGSAPPFNTGMYPGGINVLPPNFPPSCGPPPGIIGFNNHQYHPSHDQNRFQMNQSQPQIIQNRFQMSQNQPNNSQNRLQMNRHMPNMGQNRCQMNGNMDWLSRPPHPILAINQSGPRPLVPPNDLFRYPPPVANSFPFINEQPPQHPEVHGGIGGRGKGGGRGAWRGGGHDGVGCGGLISQKSQQNKQKKVKVNKRDLAKNVFYCDTCDRGFKTEDKYQEHVVNGHKKCTYKGCPFMAAPKLVQLHIAMQHKTGMAQKVWSLESEEDVKKWREERKRKFPTSDNIAKKKEEEAEKIARGEILETKDFSLMQGGRGWDRGRGRGRRGKERNRPGRGGKHQAGDSDEGGEVNAAASKNDDKPPEEVKVVRPERRTEDVRADNDEETSELEVGAPNHTSLGLLSSYGFNSSDDESYEEREKLRSSDKGTPYSKLDPSCQPSPSKKQRISPDKSKATASPYKADSVVIPDLDIKQDGSPYLNTLEENIDFNTSYNPGSLETEETNTITDGGDKKPTKGNKNNNAKSNKQMGRKRNNLPQYTLLEKLLAPDIRQERNKILQCVHFIVKNKFFDAAST